MTNPIDWEQLHAFLLIATTGSLTKAAQKANLSPPTLSRRVDALESTLGCTLFSRESTGLVLTPVGIALIDDAQSMSDAADRISMTATGKAQALAGTVRITASEIVSAFLLPPVIAEFQQRHPEIQIEIDASDLTGNLLKREADIAIRMYRPVQADVITRKLGELQIVACASTAYIERVGEPEGLEQLAELGIIGFDKSTQIIDHMTSRGFMMQRDTFPIRCDNQIVCWKLLQAGAGIGFAQRRLAQSSDDVKILFNDETLATLPVWLTAHEELRTSARVRCVYDFLAVKMISLLS